jgi:hypothetical protein
MLTIATHYVYSYGEGWDAGETRRFGTKRAATAWAKSKLPPCVTTRDCYWRDTARTDHVELTERYAGKRPSNKGRFWRNSYRPAGRIDPEVILVPSCGELGFA